jgi:hypothetical protein
MEDPKFILVQNLSFEESRDGHEVPGESAEGHAQP